MKSKKEFQNWFESEYCVKIDFYGDNIKTPMMYGRSQGKSVALCANVGWSAWQEASKLSEILIAQRDELLNALKGAISAWDGVYPHLKSDVHSQDYIEEIEWTQMQAARNAIAKCKVKS